MLHLDYLHHLAIKNNYNTKSITVKSFRVFYQSNAKGVWCKLYSINVEIQ